MQQAQENAAVTPYTNRVAGFRVAASQMCQVDLLWNGVSSRTEDITSGLPTSPVSFFFTHWTLAANSYNILHPSDWSINRQQLK